MPAMVSEIRAAWDAIVADLMRSLLSQYQMFQLRAVTLDQLRAECNFPVEGLEESQDASAS
jgi:hypothetical protein